MNKVVIVLLAIQVFSCSGVDHNPARRELLTYWGTDIVLPRYAEAHAKVSSLEESIAAVCAAPEAGQLELVRDAWWQARAPWKEVELFNFGPYREEPLRLGPKIDSWPARPTSVAEVLESDSELSVDLLAGAGVYAKGFPAIEVLLYQSVESAEERLARRCEYLLAAVKTLAGDLNRLEQSWSPDGDDFLGELTRPGEASERYEDLVDAMSEVVNRMGFAVENMRLDKLGRPVATSSPELSESFLSNRTVQDMRDNLRGIELVFFGQEEGSPSLHAFLQKQGHDLAQPIRDLLSRCRASLDATDQPFALAVINSPADIELAMEDLRVLQVFIQTEVIRAAGLIVEFNDADGD